MSALSKIFVAACLFLWVGLLAQPLGAQSCVPYTASGPIVATKNNQKIQNLVITADKGPGIDVNGKSGVTIKNVIIRHSAGPGIRLQGAANTTISGVDIIHTGGPAKGANRSDQENNIDCYDSANLTVTNARLTGGSSGIFLLQCPGSRLSTIEGHDQRGPFPRGQLVQWDKSNNARLTDFSNETSLTKSWPEDNVNVYKSKNVIIQRGLLDGNNAPTGDGVLIDVGSSDVLVEDVDGVRQGNGCFGIWGKGAGGITLRGTRCRDTVCDGVRGVPSSNSLGWAIDPERGKVGIRIEGAKYFNFCNPGSIVWDETMLDVGQFAEKDFVARKPIRAKLCQYGY